MPTPPLSTDTHDAIAAAIADGRPFALALVLKTTGSVPREPGTKALVDAEGVIHGTIGGGLLESEAQRLAVEAMRTQQPALFDFKFTGANASLNEPICGGMMRVLIDPLPARASAALAAAADAIRRRRRGVLVTTVEYHAASLATLGAGTQQWADDRRQVAGSPGDLPGASEPARVDVKWCAADQVSPSATAGSPGATAGSSSSAAALAALAQATTQCFEQPSPQTGQSVCGIAEPIIPAARLLIAGGGHVGRALAEQALLVGFEVIVVEDRQQFADADRYSSQVTTRHGEFADALREFPIDEQTYVAIVGRGHPVDMKALAACLDSPAAYIGMMGSRRKVALARKALIESGQATAEKLACVYAPIGLNLGAETVPEIAASIVAQLIAVRRTGRAPHFE